MFRAAGRDRLILSSPTDGIRPPKPPAKVIEPLEHYEVAALIEAAPERYKALVALAVGSGLRQGELFGVTASSLNMLRREVRVERQLVQVDTGPPSWGPPKSQASNRVVPLADVTLEVIAEHCQRFAPGPEGVLFTSGRGSGWVASRSASSAAIQKALTAAVSPRSEAV